MLSRLIGGHQIGIIYTWLYRALLVVVPVKKRRRRERRPLPGTLLSIAGSRHSRCQHDGTTGTLLHKLVAQIDF